MSRENGLCTNTRGAILSEQLETDRALKARNRLSRDGIFYCVMARGHGVFLYQRKDPFDKNIACFSSSYWISIWKLVRFYTMVLIISYMSG